MPVGAESVEWDNTPSPIQIIPSGTNVQLRWPKWAVHSELQSTMNSVNTGAWTELLWFKSVAEDEIIADMPAVDSHRLFRLKAPVGIPIFQFGIFYNGDLEFNGAAIMHLRGRVHSNSNLYMGSVVFQYFYRDVTASGAIENSLRYFASTNPITTPYFYGAAVSNAPRLVWPVDEEMGPEAVRQIIQIPPPDEEIGSPLGRERYFNKAELVILVTNTSVEAFLKRPYSAERTTLPWLAITNFVSTNKTFVDQREVSKTALTTEFDVGRFNLWAATNAEVASVLRVGVVPNIAYIADRRLPSSSKFAVVRVVNGRVLAERGLTVATPNPLYTLGHFNQPTTAHLGTTNTADTRPASLVCDAYTLLSGAFRDQSSSGHYITRPASNTTVVAAIVAGNTPSAAVYSGGANNLPRLLEAWSTRTYTLNGSLVCLYPSAVATNVFRNPGVYYNAPTRNIYFDFNFLDPARLPPGTPQVGVSRRSELAH